VYTNDPNRAQFSIGVKAIVQTIFSTSPQERFTIFTLVGKPASQALTLTNTLPDPIKITRISHNLGETVEVKLKPVAAGRSYQLILHTDAIIYLRRAGYVRLGLSGAPVKEALIKAFVIVRNPKKINQELPPREE